jgi:hypothetical protein
MGNAYLRQVHPNVRQAVPDTTLHLEIEGEQLN